MAMMKPDPQVMPSSSHATPSPVNESTGHLTGFHDLSGEIRNTIYRMSLAKDKSISIVRLYDLVKPKPKPKLVTGISFRTRRSTLPFPDKVYDRDLIHNLGTAPPALLQASKSIRQEASQIYYLENTFCFVDSALHANAVDHFFLQVGKLWPKFLQVEIFRTIRLAWRKEPVEVRFTLRGDDPCGFLAIKYPKYIERVSVVGFAVMRGPYNEPCRCEVRSMARHTGAPHSKQRTGRDLWSFLVSYTALLNSEATQDFMDICATCGTIYRT